MWSDSSTAESTRQEPAPSVGSAPAPTRVRNPSGVQPAARLEAVKGGKEKGFGGAAAARTVHPAGYSGARDRVTGQGLQHTVALGRQRIDGHCGAVIQSQTEPLNCSPAPPQSAIV